MRRVTPGANNGLAAALAVAGMIGYLLFSGALDPVLHQAISRMQPTAATETGPAVSRIADWQYFDERPEWSTVRQVPTAPTAPRAPVGPARPAIAPPENPHRVIFSGPAPMRRYKLEGMDSCPPPRGPGHQVQQFGAVPGLRSATVSWWDLGDPDTETYQLAIVPVGATGNPIGFTDETTITEPVRYQEVPAPKACRRVTVQIAGLKSGDAYRFWLVANNESQVQKEAKGEAQRRYRTSRGQSETITAR